MKNRVNYILITLLWLLAVTLGASFWFNTKYGFNIFLSQHWQYLAYMQASGQPINYSFYLSLVIVIFITMFGLFLLLQPHHRKIVIPVTDLSNTQTQQQNIGYQRPTTVPATNIVTEQKTETRVAPVSSATAPVRPPRLNIPTVTQRISTPAPMVPLRSSNRVTNPEQDYADIHNVFTSAGFVYKGAPRIKNVQTAVIAIGTDEVLWIGAKDVSLSDMQRAVDTLQGVFTDTLEDLEINVNAFIIGAPQDSENNDDIMIFATVDDLRAYISAHPNTPPSEDEQENFDAYSGYIGTVVDYIGKI